jgi:hypothetical protein
MIHRHGYRTTTEVELLPLEQIERACERNAAVIVLLRHTIASAHQYAPGHGKVPWTICNHPECQKVAILLGERKPSKIAALVAEQFEQKRFRAHAEFA